MRKFIMLMVVSIFVYGACSDSKSSQDAQTEKDGELQIDDGTQKYDSGQEGEINNDAFVGNDATEESGTNDRQPGDGSVTICGPEELQCDPVTQVCLVRGPFGPTYFYSCATVPKKCEKEHTCKCLEQELCAPRDTCVDQAENTILCDNGMQ